MTEWLRHHGKLLLLSLGHMVTDLNHGAITLVAVYLKDRFDLTYFMVGLIILVSTVSSSVIQPLFGAFSDRCHTPWLMPAGILAAGVGLAAAALAPNYPLALLAIFISGLGVAAFHPEGSKGARRVSGRGKASAMSVFSVGGNLGFGLGPLLAGFLYKLWGMAGMAGFLIPSSAAALWLGARLKDYQADAAPISPHPSSAVEALEEKGAVWGPLTTLTAIVIIRSWIQAGLATYIPLYVIDILAQSKETGAYLLSLFLIAGAVGTLFGGFIADRFGARKLIMASMVLLVPLLWYFPYSRGLGMEILLFFAGAILVSTFSSTIVMGQEMLPHRIGTVSGLMIGFAIGMGGIGVMAFGKMADAFGILPVLQTIALLPLLGAALTLLLVYGWRKKSDSPASSAG